jgi:lysophospholipase L1-like esterase
MSYQKHNFKNGQVLTAEDLNEIEDGIVAIEREAVTSIELSNEVNDAIAQAKESGEFDGRDGDDYVLTEADKIEIAEMAAEMVDVPDPGWNEELHDIRTGYNQITYPNAGDAVRGQSKQLANFMQAMASMDSDLLDLSGAVFVNGKYVNEDGTVSVHSSLKYTQDYINIEPDWESFTVLKIVYGITNGTETTIGVPIVIFYTSSGVAGGISSENITHDGDLVTYKIPHWATSARINFGTTNPIDIVRVNKFKNGKVGAFAGTFTEYKQKLFTGIYLRKNQTYLIRKENVADPFNVFLENDSSPFVRMRKHTHEKYFTPDSAGQLVLYNEANFGHLGEVNVSVYRAEDERLLIEKQPKVYTIGDKEQEYDYTSFTQCLIDLKDDKSPKIIYINEGDYNIYQEYKDAGVPVYTGDSPTYDYPEYCVWIPDNTHIIGRGIVRLMWMPDPNEVDLTYNESVTVSPVNCAGTMTLENVEIHCKNGRYCIHDDVLGNGEFTNAIKKYINVRCYKYANDEGFGFKPTTGFGVDRNMRYEFHNCIFKNEAYYPAFYMHDRKTVANVNLTEKMGSNVVATNCVMDTNGTISVKFGNSTSAARIRADFNSCWFSGKINIKNESSDDETICPNSWDVKLCLCNAVEIDIADPDNLYPPSVYPGGNADDKADKTYAQDVYVDITEADVEKNALATPSGTTAYTDIWDSTKMIALPFDVGTPITVRCTFNGTGGLVFFNSSGEVLGAVNGNNVADYGLTPGGAMQVLTLPPPDGTTHIRMCAFKGDTGTYSAPSDFVLKGQVSVDVVEMVRTLDERTKLLNTQTKTVSVGITDKDIVPGGFITGYPGREGVFVTSSGWIATDFIPLVFDKGTPVTFRCTIYANVAMAFYNQAGAVVGAVTSHNAADYGIEPSAIMQQFSVVPPVNAEYVRMSASEDTNPSDFTVQGQVTTNIATQLRDVKVRIDANITDFRNVKTLVIGDSISTDYYGNYKKWVSHLIDSGFFNVRNMQNDSIHATGFVARYNNEENDFLTRIEAVADKETFDLVVIFGGINDFIQNIPMGESGNDKATYFKPAVDYFFDYLVNNFTQARIAVLSPLRTRNTNANTAGNKQEVYTDYIKTVAKSYCIPVLNLTDESGFCPFIPSFRDRWTLTEYSGGDGVTGDGVHPSEEYSRRYLAPMIRGFLKGLM